MPSDHPFQQLFETFGKLPGAHAEQVNAAARESVRDWLSVPLGKAGHCILLKAPAAGHGKTHLLTRVQYDLGGTHEFIPLNAVGGSRIDASTVLNDTLRRLVRGLPAAGGLTVLDLVARRLFSTSLQPLVNSGEVPCQDREGALNALKTRPIETFDFHHPGAVTAHWARENFELLGPRLALELSQRNGLSLREVSFWVDSMFRFSATPIDNPGRSRALAATVFEDPSSETVAHERLVALLGLMTSMMRVVLVADELEGFSSDESAALKFASFLGALRQSVERIDVVISVNQDIWQSAFLPRLSGGLADRLSEVVVELEPLDHAGMSAILDSRSPGDGERLLGEMEKDELPDRARELIKRAGVAWEKLEKSNGPLPEAFVEKAIFEGGLAPGFEPEKSTEPEPEQEPDPEGVPLHEEISDPLPVAESEIPLAEISEPRTAEPEPAELPKEPRFSAEAAIAAFKGFSDKDSAQESLSQEPEVPDPVYQPSSWPSPIIAETPFQTAPEPNQERKIEEEPTFEPTATEPAPLPEPVASEPVPEPVREPTPPPFHPAPEPTPSPFQAAPTLSGTFPPSSPEEAKPDPAGEPTPPPFQAAPALAPVFPPPSPSSDEPATAAAPFQAAPTYEEPPPFQAAPTPEPAPEVPMQAFQAAPEPPSAPAFAEPAPDPPDFKTPKTDRVDDLLKQFRERYGKG